MSGPEPPDLYREPEPDGNEEILLYAWAQMSVYDRTATTLKIKYIRRRQIVTILILAATITSILTGIWGEYAFSIVLGAVAIILPVFATILMGDIVMFTGTTDWIKYRYVAEMMRMHIYLFRMGTGLYGELPENKRDDELVKQLGIVRDSVDMGNVVPAVTEEPTEKKAIEEDIYKANTLTREEDQQGDNGISPIDIEKYVRWRIEGQRNWYERKIKQDFALLKRHHRAAKGFLAVGTIAGAFAIATQREIIAMVAITNSIAAALSLWSQVAMVGKTYALFKIASNKLSDELGNYIALKNNPAYLNVATRPTEINKVVKRVENVLEWERKEWYELALQAQAVTDEKIFADLERLNNRANEAQELDEDDDNGQDGDDPEAEA